MIAHSAKAVQYTDYFSAEEYSPTSVLDKTQNHLNVMFQPLSCEHEQYSLIAINPRSK